MITRRRFLYSASAGFLWSSQNPFAAVDLVIAGGTIVDGSGRPPYRADIGVREGRIASIGDLKNAAGRRTIRADGLTVAPGFIDIHNHSDDTLLTEPLCESMVRQGVTTMVLGEGSSAGPVPPGQKDWSTLGEYFAHVEKRKVAVNICSYVGQGQVWTYVKGFDHSPAQPRELAEMKRLVAAAMKDGAMGLSTSLLMPPANLITTGQLAELSEVARQYGGIYSTHIRDEGLGVFRSVQEAIDVGKRARIPADIIHLKIAHKDFWGRMNEIVALIHKARAEGLNVQANVYPYTAGQNNLSAIVPPWAHAGGREQMLERLKNRDDRARMRAEILNGLPDWYNHYLATGGGWEGMLLVSLSQPDNKRFVGKRMGELIRSRGGDPVEVFFDLLIEEKGSVPTVFFHHAEEDMQLAMKQPFTSIGSDGAAVSPDGPSGRSHPHPRYYGAFPRVLGRYARELKLLTLPEAVRKMTGMNAEKIGISERGHIKEGSWADITLFDAEKIIDRATFENPHQYAIGIQYVLVNGTIILEQDKRTASLPGRVLRRRQF